LARQAGVGEKDAPLFQFETKKEAEQWIANHHWMTEQPQEPGAAEADDPDAGPPDNPLSHRQR
jgi:hypothetical protein